MKWTSKKSWLKPATRVSQVLNEPVNPCPFSMKKHVWNHQIGTKIPSNFGQTDAGRNSFAVGSADIGGFFGAAWWHAEHIRYVAKLGQNQGVLVGCWQAWNGRDCAWWKQRFWHLGNARIYAGMHILGSLRIRGLWSIKLTHISSHQWGLPDAGADPEQTPWSIGW